MSRRISEIAMAIRTKQALEREKEHEQQMEEAMQKHPMCAPLTIVAEIEQQIQFAFALNLSSSQRLNRQGSGEIAVHTKNRKMRVIINMLFILLPTGDSTYEKALKDKWNVEIIWQVPRSPETNMLDLGVWACAQSATEREHLFKCGNADSLERSVKKAWTNLVSLEALTKVHDRFKVVLALIVEDKGKNNLVEKKRGKLFRDMTIPDEEEGVEGQASNEGGSEAALDIEDDDDDDLD